MQIFYNLVWSIICFVAGLTVKYFFDAYVNKIAKIRYIINKSFLGISSEDNLFGKVQVIYNEHPVKNLFLCNIVLVNTSNKDFKNITITVWCDSESYFLISHAYKAGSISPYDLTKEFYDNFKTRLESGNGIIATQRPFNIPVLNREDSITFSCLVTNINSIEPYVYLDCEHPGLRLEADFVQPKLYWGENQNTGAWIGLVIGVILVSFFMYLLNANSILIIFAYLMGVYAILPGVLTLKIIKGIKKIFR